jgi:Ca-dependent carbohydrate-binding module xylan-binding
VRYLRLTIAGLVTAAIALPLASPATAADTTLEAESMVVSPPGAGRTYSASSASGGTALGLWRNSSAATNLSLPASISVVVRAKGQSCRGAPSMTVSIDGKAISTTNVSATSWTDYTTATTIPAGSHTLSIAFTNNYQRGWGCDRNLLLDKVTVAAGNTTTTPPTTTTPTTTTPPTTTPPTTTPPRAAPTHRRAGRQNLAPRIRRRIRRHQLRHDETHALLRLELRRLHKQLQQR